MGIALSIGISVVSAAIALGSLVWNIHHGRLMRQPKLSIDAARSPIGADFWPSRDQGMFAESDPAATVDFVACTIVGVDDSVITKAGLIPSSKMPRPSWRASKAAVDLTGSEYVADAATPDPGKREMGMHLAQFPSEQDLLRLPRQVTDHKLVLRLDVEIEHRDTIRPGSSVRLWVETSTGHRCYSEPTTAWSQRYRAQCAVARTTRTPRVDPGGHFRTDDLRNAGSATHRRCCRTHVWASQ